VSTRATWQDFGLPPRLDGHDVMAATASRNGTRTVTTAQRRQWGVRRPGRPGERDRASIWLRNAMIALGALAAAAAIVSFSAQYLIVLAYRGDRPIAALEAAIPDAAALVFASLGIALALHGKRAVRARLLNVAAVATSVFMNFAAAAPGWRGLAIWVMPPVAYALASDTAIGVIRAWTIARAREMHEDLADDEATPLVILGGLLLWVLRLALAPWSTLTGFRAWVVAECPVAPGRTVERKELKELAATMVAAVPAGPLHTSVTMGCPFCTVLDREADGRCVGCGATDEQRAQAVLAAELGHALRARGGDRRRPGRRGVGRDWDALSEPVRKRYAGAGITQEAYESGASLDTARGHQSGSAA
jgi:hypothetical protein